MRLSSKLAPAAVGVALVGGLGLSACGTTTVIRPAPKPAVTVTKPAPAAHPRPTVTATRQAAPAAPAPAGPPDNGAGPGPGASDAQYAQDIANAGITAPYGWLMTTGATLCADWANGESTADTDPILQAGGIYADHLATFDAITQEDLCP